MSHPSYPLLHHTVEGQGPFILLIHGLFGSADNLGVLARNLRLDHTVINVDLRNHGRSFHCDSMNYEAMAKDLIQLLNHLNVDSLAVVGHSMGGKAAMKLASMIPDNIHHLAVLDMAPVAYQQRRHDNVLAGLQAVVDNPPTNRQQALAIMEEHIEIEGVRQFLAKSLFHPKSDQNSDNHLQWRFNLKALSDQYDHIQAWSDIAPFNNPTLFLKGADSDYIGIEHQAQIQAQFPHSKAHIINNTGHWLHAEKPTEVLRSLRRFITK
ncbi:alpha/beta fold hydrolase [Vibrio algicola]|uniref:Alpha/beta fold hydrolase n=1 Tax=Vibrio algicola TaxID=2662262 RepID=A0A5Q0TJ04_9VIBR|nr:alpha/beta fold hydrolase [Vibrio algicola]